MVAIVDYGLGNLFSLKSSLNILGVEAVVTSDPQVLMDAERIILPGVGAYRDASEKLKSSGLDKVVIKLAKEGKPLMGICLGMQLLLDKGYEYGEYDGLGLIPGNVRDIKAVIPMGFKVPHIGWNKLKVTKNIPFLKYVKEGDSVYFVHSYHGTECEDYICATTEYGAEITAAVAKDNVMGCQFHPEKSGQVGLDILRGFCEL